MPASSDVNLSRAVVLVGWNHEAGAFGLVINHPSPITVVELLQSLELTWRGDASAVVFAGGPVAPQEGWVLHEEPGAGVVFTNQLERLRELADKPPANIRFLLGSIDWLSGQLDEVAALGAIHTAATPELVFGTAADALWERIQVVGTPVQLSIGAWFRRKLGISTIPKATLRRK